MNFLGKEPSRASAPGAITAPSPDRDMFGGDADSGRGRGPRARRGRGLNWMLWAVDSACSAGQVTRLR
jgi:hypothetical protein